MLNRKRKSTEDFINEARLKHGDLFDYSKVVYFNNKTKVLIGCRNHGFFEQRPSSHLFGYGCHECLKNNRNPYKGKESEFEKKFKQRSSKIHNGKYDYSLVNYERHDKKIKIICPDHGIFHQVSYEHYVRGSGCPKCVGKFKTNFEFIESCNIIHNNKYKYDLCDYKNSDSIIKIVCPNHGTFSQIAKYHISGSGCIGCKESKGEKIVRQFLLLNKIEFIPQKRFDDCYYKYKLPFDFYLPDYNICIEYNGIQHYESFKFFGGIEAFNERIKRDEIKIKYCISNNIKLIIIKYNDNIFETLSNHIKIVNT
jgi:hypothetical protein